MFVPLLGKKTHHPTAPWGRIGIHFHTNTHFKHEVLIRPSLHQREYDIKRATSGNVVAVVQLVSV